MKHICSIEMDDSNIHISSGHTQHKLIVGMRILIKALDVYWEAQVISKWSTFVSAAGSCSVAQFPSWQ